MFPLRSMTAGFTCLIAAGFAHADILPVIVRHSGNDAVGKRLVVEIKNSIRSNPVFSLVYSSQDALYDISVVTLDPDEYNSQSRTIYSVTLLLKNVDGFDYYLTSMVGTCGRQRLASCAEGIVQDLGVENEGLLEALAQASVWE